MGFTWFAARVREAENKLQATFLLCAETSLCQETHSERLRHRQLGKDEVYEFNNDDKIRRKYLHKIHMNILVGEVSIEVCFFSFGG